MVGAGSRMWQLDDRRDPGGTPQEQNSAEIRGQDVEQDTETEAHTSEPLTKWLSQMQKHRREGQRRRWYVSEQVRRIHRESHGGDGEDCDECNDRRATTRQQKLEFREDIKEVSLKWKSKRSFRVPPSTLLQDED